MITAEYTIPGLHVREHEIAVPLDWTGPDGSPTITVFAREVVAAHRRHEDLPLVLFLQGGPGGKSPRPLDAGGWLGVLLDRYRVVLLDQRGTGRSTRVDAARMASFGSAEQAATYLAFFRADSIVRDAEHLRRTVFDGRRWTTFGQSYGGWITLEYLSAAPEGLAACMVTGGLASLHPDAADLYRRTYPRALAKNLRFERRYPEDIALIGHIADLLSDGDVRLPDGDRLTVRRLQFLGGARFGMQHGFEELHWLLDTAFGSGGRLSDTFLESALTATSFADDPLWAALQEAAEYTDDSSGATRWAAQAEHDRHPEFGEDVRPLRFTGEMFFPWMFEEIRLLRPFGPAVQLLQQRTDWPARYDLVRLAANEVPVAAAVYFDDLYVDADLQLQTASEVANLTTWVTNEWEHDGIAASGGEVVRHLLRQLDERGGHLR
ncbi:alpha/beta fold hydrolase [Amnibacterium sp.]|uniref:alpha/beta fold hydrolase n=1 Tax=Amnibacterium sp. TaxID=1872496 RepID=UPI0026159785|nr:alpha/beta fold hydrolase [Amnibacterium sp.]MCU1472237.1 proline iminopeptidase [Amnibacterium sp.]